MYRFATYLGAVVEKLEDGELAIRQGPYHVQIRFPNSGGTLLKAPESELGVFSEASRSPSIISSMISSCARTGSPAV